MAGYGVIGKERGSNRKAERVIIANLDDLCEAAAQSDEEFYLYIAVPKSMGQGLLDVLTWAVERQVWYKLFYEKGYLDADVFAGAEEKVQVADYATALEHVVQECADSGLDLLALYTEPGEDEELDEAVSNAMGVGVTVKMLNDAGLEAFEAGDDEEAEDEDEASEEDEDGAEATEDDDDDEDVTPDRVKEYGEKADAGDVDAATQLEAWAESADIDASAIDTWAEVAEMLAGMLDTDGDEEAAEEAAEPDAKAVARAEFAGKHIRTLRSAALAQGWNANDIKDKDEIIAILVGEKPQPATALPKGMTTGEIDGKATTMNGSVNGSNAVAGIVARYMRALADELEHLTA